MSEAKRENRINKLKKCLALSASSEPHEAAAALRQARALMQELDLTEDDLQGLEMADAVVKTREGYGACQAMYLLVGVIMEVFGVQAICERNPGSANRLNVRYVGPRDRVLLSEYSHRVLWRAMTESWAKILEQRPHLKGVGGKRQSFFVGWLAGVNSKIEALVPTQAETDAMDRFTLRKFGELNSTKAAKQIPISPAMFNAGMSAAEDFSLHIPVEEKQLALGHN